MKSVPIILCLVAIFVGIGEGQVLVNNPSKAIKIDSSFSISSPVDLKRQPSDLAGGAVKVFAGLKDKDTYIVYVVPYEKVPSSDADFRESVGGLQFILGGDDDYDFDERFETVNGRRAKGLVYRKQNVRGLMVDGGKKIYVIGYITENRERLTSAGINEFFRSFKFSGN